MYDKTTSILYFNILRDHGFRKERSDPIKDVFVICMDDFFYLHHVLSRDADASESDTASDSKYESSLYTSFPYCRDQGFFQIARKLSENELRSL